VHSLRVMFGRRVHSDQLQRHVSHIHKLVLSSTGHDDHIAGFDVLLPPADFGPPCSGCEDQDLVDCVDLVLCEKMSSTTVTSGTYFIANITVDWHFHCNQLRV
jgi:hypothetical protein